MKRLKNMIWVMLGVAVSITLWSCGEKEEVIKELSNHPFLFFFEDEAGNDILVELNDGGILSDEPNFFQAFIKNRCSYLSLDNEIRNEWIGIVRSRIYDEWISINRSYIYDASELHEFVLIDPMCRYSKLWLRLFKDDVEDIVFEAKNINSKDDWHTDIVWLFKGKEISRTFSTLVRHNDGTYTLKE